MLTGLRILYDVALFRLRRREMANVAAVACVMVALRLELTEMAVRLLLALVLNLFVYLANDYYDIEADLASSRKDRQKVLRLKAHKDTARLCQVLLVALVLGIGALWSRELFMTALVASGAGWAYSAKLKHVPIVDVLAVTVCGMAGGMVGSPLHRTEGWILAGLLGLFAAAFQTIQLVRDHDEDARFGIGTTAVRYGQAATVLLQRLLIAAAALYSFLLVHWWIGPLVLVAALLPFEARRADRHWNRVRLTLGVIWLATIGWVVSTGTLPGLLRVNPSQEKAASFMEELAPN